MLGLAVERAGDLPLQSLLIDLIGRVEHQQMHASHVVIDIDAIRLHVRRNRVRLECGEVFPLLYDDDLVGTNLGLIGQISLGVHSGAVFDAALLCADVGNDFPERGQVCFSRAWREFNGGDDVDHFFSFFLLHKLHVYLGQQGFHLGLRFVGVAFSVADEREGFEMHELLQLRQTLVGQVEA